MTVELLAQITGIVLSLAMAYIPGLSEWYAGKDGKTKARIMAGLLIVVSVSIFGLACTGIAVDIGLALICDKTSAIALIKILLAALIANQTTYLVAVRPFKS